MYLHWDRANFILISYYHMNIINTFHFMIDERLINKLVMYTVIQLSESMSRILLLGKGYLHGM